MIKKIITIAISFLIFFPLSEARLEKPAWREGNYWKYEISLNKTKKDVLTVKIEKKEIIEYENNSYEVFNISQISEKGSKRISYIRVGDLATLKDIDFYEGKELERIYSPPAHFFLYNIDVGEMISQFFKVSNGGTVYISIQSQCIGKEEIKINSEKYECYKIVEKRRYGNENLSYVFYYSEKTGNWIKMVGLNESIEIILLETNYNIKKTPLPTAILFFSLIISIIFRKMKKLF
ncbi:MAG: hypothetical protein QXW78_01420 [Candidatus Thermoplasmatota archaeon]